MKPSRRALLLVLAATVALVMFDQDKPARSTDVAEPRQPVRAAPADRRAAQPAPPAFDATRLDRIAERTRSEQEPKDPFGVDEPAPAAMPLKVQPAPPPPPPQAPEIPFRYLGSQEAGGARTLFLEQQQETHIVKVGDIIANAWRLDEVNQHSAVFTYVPLGQRRTLSLGGPG